MAEKPEVVIISTGSKPFISSLPRFNQRNVITAWDVLEERVEVGEQAVFILNEKKPLDPV